MFHRIRVAFCYQSIADSMVRWFDFWRTDFLDNTEENKERGTDRPDGSRCAKRQIQIVQNSAADWLSILSRSTGASFWNGRGTFYIAWTNRTQVKQQNHFENTLHSRTHSRVWKKRCLAPFLSVRFHHLQQSIAKRMDDRGKKIECIKFCSIVTACNLRCAGGPFVGILSIEIFPFHISRCQMVPKLRKTFSASFFHCTNNKHIYLFQFSLHVTAWKSGIDGNRAKQFHSYHRFKLLLIVRVPCTAEANRRDIVSSSMASEMLFECKSAAKVTDAATRTEQETPPITST